MMIGSFKLYYFFPIFSGCHNPIFSAAIFRFPVPLISHPDEKVKIMKAYHSSIEVPESAATVNQNQSKDFNDKVENFKENQSKIQQQRLETLEIISPSLCVKPHLCDFAGSSALS